MKSLLIVTSLQKRLDLKAVRLIRAYKGSLNWEPLDDLMIDQEVWDYAVHGQGFPPKMVFCHPTVLQYRTETSLYYRGLCGLSQKATRDYVGAVERFETGGPKVRLSSDRALKMARTYNTFLCSIIRNSTDWTLENGKRTIIATLGITLDGKMRNKVGEIAEERIRAIVLDWVVSENLLVRPHLSREEVLQVLPIETHLLKDVTMKFGSEPDISFVRDGEYLVVVEIKGGIDPAGALERYGAATKSFQSAVSTSPRCQNFFLSAVFTEELSARIQRDRLVNKSFNIVKILDDPSTKRTFLTELFHHALRLT